MAVIVRLSIGNRVLIGGVLAVTAVRIPGRTHLGVQIHLDGDGKSTVFDLPVAAAHALRIGKEAILTFRPADRFSLMIGVYAPPGMTVVKRTANAISI